MEKIALDAEYKNELPADAADVKITALITWLSPFIPAFFMATVNALPDASEAPPNNCLSLELTMTLILKVPKA